MHYKLSDYSFELPQDRIAQKPAVERTDSRLLVAQGSTGVKDCKFNQIQEFLNAGDVLVLNQTKVMNARCRARKENGLNVEVFVLELSGTDTLIPVLLKPARRVKPGMNLIFPNSGVSTVLEEKEEQGRCLLRFPSREALFRVLEEDGEIPLPPYIKRENGPDAQDEERYQTVFASEYGAVAAPTAGLHFSQELLSDLEKQGVQLCRVTHHVGIGTFKPVSVDDVRDHIMDAEHFHISRESAEMLNLARENRRRIIAVGTTSTRCLEACISDGHFNEGFGKTDLYIYPPYNFAAVDALITNFHLPGSTLMLLVSALMGRERIMALYQHALERDYRFYSYGDAMFLDPQKKRE